MGFRPIDPPARVPDPPPIPLCPWCLSFIEPGQDTAKVNGLNWHAGCAEDCEQAEAKEGPQ